MLVVDDGYDTLVQMKNSGRLISIIRVLDLNRDLDWYDTKEKAAEIAKDLVDLATAMGHKVDKVTAFIKTEESFKK